MSGNSSAFHSTIMEVAVGRTCVQRFKNKVNFSLNFCRSKYGVSTQIVFQLDFCCTQSDLFCRFVLASFSD
jgi:hypothetical protein